VRDLRDCNCENPIKAYGMQQKVSSNYGSSGANSYAQSPRYVKSRY
jgi:hypothetical protein